jgi:hypothetical protein
MSPSGISVRVVRSEPVLTVIEEVNRPISARQLAIEHGTLALLTATGWALMRVLCTLGLTPGALAAAELTDSRLSTILTYPQREVIDPH